MAWTVADARAFAHAVHEGQADRHGRVLAEHLDAVRERVEQMGGEEVDQVAALLHHCASDGSVAIGDLGLLGVPERAVTIVDALTRRPGEPEREQIHRVMGTPGAVRVLRADLAYQLHPDQLRQVSPAERDRMLRRCCGILDELDKEPELTFR
jgi:predicted ThiF/HesA family dinucleotide-utilizing enzyme